MQGRLLNRFGGRIEHLRRREGEIEVPPDQRVRFWFHWVESRSAMRRDRLLELAPGSIELGEFRIEYPHLEIHPGERIGVAGPNGSGKSSLLRHLLARFEPEESAYLPQEIDQRLAAELRSRLEMLNNVERGHLLAIINALGTDPVRLSDSADLSAGELRKIWLALETLRRPALLILDEPGNHLDLPSLESFEKALIDFPGAILAVSHDREFLSSLGPRRWLLERSDMRSRVRVEVESPKPVER